MKTLHLSIIVILFVVGTGIVFAQSNNMQIQNGVSSTNSTCTDNIIQDIKTKYASFDEERAKTEAVNYDVFKSEVKNDKYIFRAVSQEWTNDQVKCDVTFKNALVLFVVTDSSGKDRDVTVLINPVSYKPQSIDVKYDVPTHGGIMTAKIQSPLKQLEAGTNADQVKCNQGLQLIFKQENMSPICVKPDTSKILIERGWATNISPPNHMTGTKINDPFGITALIIYSPPSVCLSSPSNTTMPSCPPNNFYLKINSNSTAYLLGYNICDGESCTKKNDLSVLLPINILLKPDYQMIGLPVNLQWKYGDTVHIQLEVSPNADNKTASLIDLGNSTIVP